MAENLRAAHSESVARGAELRELKGAHNALLRRYQAADEKAAAADKKAALAEASAASALEQIGLLKALLEEEKARSNSRVEELQVSAVDSFKESAEYRDNISDAGIQGMAVGVQQCYSRCRDQHPELDFQFLGDLVLDNTLEQDYQSSKASPAVEVAREPEVTAPEVTVAEAVAEVAAPDVAVMDATSGPQESSAEPAASAQRSVAEEGTEALPAAPNVEAEGLAEVLP